MDYKKKLEDISHYNSVKPVEKLVIIYVLINLWLVSWIVCNGLNKITIVAFVNVL